MKIVSVVPIKTNNERLPGKNTKELGKKPLFRYILETLLSEERIAERYLYSSDEKLKEMLPDGIRFLKRDPVLDLPESNFHQIFDAFSSEIKADIYVYAHATAPYITKETLVKCVTAVEKRGFDSAFTAEKIQDFLWRDGLPLNFDARHIPRSQDLPVVFRETSGVYVFKAETYRTYRQRIGEKPFICEVTKREAVDINTAEDFEMAERLL